MVQLLCMTTANTSKFLKKQIKLWYFISSKSQFQTKTVLVLKIQKNLGAFPLHLRKFGSQLNYI